MSRTRLFLNLDYSQPVTPILDEIDDLEAAGLDGVTMSQAYSFDAVSALGAIAARTSRLEVASAILNIYGRSAATIAMTGAGLGSSLADYMHYDWRHRTPARVHVVVVEP